MKSLRTLPPAASIPSLRDLISGMCGMIYSHRYIDSFTNSLQDFFYSRYCFLLSSGKAALTMVFEVLRDLHPDRYEVIVPAFNCFSVPSAVFRANLVTRPCDIDPLTLQFNLKSLRAILKNSNHILAICPTHFFGYPSDIDCIRKDISDEKITIIEDAAQVMGGEVNRRLFGMEGDISIFSFSRGKALSAGEGGVILTNREDLGIALNTKYRTIGRYSPGNLFKLIFSNFALYLFINPGLFWIPRRLPFLKLGETVFDPSFPCTKIHSFQAGLLKDWKKRLIRDISQRYRRCKLYTLMLDNVDGLSLIRSNIKSFQPASIRFPVVIHKSQFVEKIIAESNIAGLGISRTYPDSIDSIPQLLINDSFPDARRLTETLITLPCHSLVSASDIVKIVTLIKQILSQ